MNGTFVSSTNNKYISIIVQWVSTPNILNNTSEVKAVYYATKSNGTSYPTYDTAELTLSLDTVTKYVRKYLNLNVSNNWVYIGELITTVSHNADGTKNVYIGMSGGMPDRTWTKSYCSQWVTLDNIPRATIPSFNSSNIAPGEKLSISLPRASESFIHQIKYEWNSQTYTIASDVETSYEWTVPADFIYDMPNANEKDCIIHVDTYNTDGSFVATASAAIKIIIPESYTPKINNVICTDSSTQVPQDWKVFIQKKSILHVKVEATPSTGASIVSYSIQALGTTILNNDVDIGTIDLTTVPIVANITDSRGRMATYETVISAIPCENISLVITSCERADSQGNLIESGNYASIKLSCAVPSLNFQALSENEIMEHNKIKIIIKYQSLDGEENGLLQEDYESIRLNDKIFLIENMISDKTYDYEIEVVDIFENTATAYCQLTSEGGVISFLGTGDGISFGKSAELSGQADFNWLINARKGLLLGEEIDFEKNLEGLLTEEGRLVRDNTLNNLGLIFSGNLLQVGNLKIQWGITDTIVTDPATFNSTTITFGDSFSNPPFVFGTLMGQGALPSYYMALTLATRNNINATFHIVTDTDFSARIAWLAIGN